MTSPRPIVTVFDTGNVMPSGSPEICVEFDDRASMLDIGMAVGALVASAHQRGMGPGQLKRLVAHCVRPGTFNRFGARRPITERAENG